MNRLSFLSSFTIITLMAVFLTACSHPSPFREFLKREGRHFHLLIHNGQVWNGQDSLPVAADMLIRNDSILYIGPVEQGPISVETVIDAGGRAVTPGFIDTHAHGDPMSSPGFENFLAMGVTTICLGQDGDSPEVEDIRPWMRSTDSIAPGVNIAMFVGHGTLRHLSGTGYKPLPASGEMAKMEALLRDALAAGCFGMSTGLEYTPGTYAGDAELAALARVVGEHDGLVMSHVRNEDDNAVAESIRELLRQGQYCDVHVSHLKVVYGKGEERAEAVLALLDSARRAGPFGVTADLYPYTASYTGIGIVFPQWAKPPNDYAQVKVERRAELLNFLRQKVEARNGPEATLFGSGAYAGKTLADLSAEQGVPFEEVLLDIGPDGASGAYFVMDEALQARLLEDPHLMICSDGSPGMHHPRGYGSFARIIEQYVQKEGRLSMAEALRKMTALPARTLGLKDRGLLMEGYKADLLIFQPGEVKAKATFSNPHQLAEGIDWVIVNGKVAMENGQLKVRTGRMLRKQ